MKSQANDPFSRLFNFKVSSANPNVSIQEESKAAWFNQSTLLWVALGVTLLLLVWKRSYNLKVDLIDQSPQPTNPTV